MMRLIKQGIIYLAGQYHWPWRFRRQLTWLVRVIGAEGL